MRAAVAVWLPSEPVRRLLAGSPAGGRSDSAWARPSPGFGSPGPRPSLGAAGSTAGCLRVPACASSLSVSACRRAATSMGEEPQRLVLEPQAANWVGADGGRGHLD